MPLHEAKWAKAKDDQGGLKMKEDSVQAIAETTGKAIDATREAGGFIARYIGGPLDEAVGIVEDKLRYVRWERQIRLFQRAEEFLRLSGLQAPTRAVPMQLAIPIVLGASLEEDDSLQDRWAALLVNAANARFPGEVRRAYASILEQLTPLDAKILDALYSVPVDPEIKDAALQTKNLPHRARAIDIDGPEARDRSLPQDDVVIALANLVRLGCIRTPLTWSGVDIFSMAIPTIMGREFVRACTIAL